MPYSSDEGKQFVKDFFTDKKEIRSVLDVGPGSGTYARLLRPVLPLGEFIGVEIWAPYISQFSLESLYTKVIVADIRYLDWSKVGTIDLTILGDVLEHLPSFTAITDVLAEAVHRSRYVVVSIPIIEYPQGAELGNKWETHESSWTGETVRNRLLAPYEIIDYTEGEVVGTYIIGGDQR